MSRRAFDEYAWVYATRRYDRANRIIARSDYDDDSTGDHYGGANDNHGNNDHGNDNHGRALYSSLLR